MFNIGVDTFIWSENFGTEDLWIIEKAKQLGFATLDISISHPETFPVAEVRKELRRVGIPVVTTTTLGPSTNLISSDPAVVRTGIEILKKLVDINVQIGSPIIGGVNYAAWGYLSGKPRTEVEWNTSIRAMKEIAKYARQQGEVAICLEPVNRFETHFLNIAEDAVRYCKEVGYPNVKVHLDTFHMIREEVSFAQAVRTCGKEYLGYVHVCENNRGIPGTGLVPWKEFFSALKEIGYTGPMCIESFDPSFVELNRLCAIWRKFADTGEELAVKGKSNLEAIIKSL
jgi:D-psicose/D-tagatose/L-ribulose 3-epimerase